MMLGRRYPQPLEAAGPLTLVGKFPCCGGGKKPIRTSMLCNYRAVGVKTGQILEVIRSLGSVRLEHYL